MDDIHDWIADERRRLADLVESLTPAQLATPSLCSAWSVHDVAAHLLMPLVTPMPRVVLAMARNGFDFDRANLGLTAAVARRTPGQIAAGLREHAQKRFKPPGLGFEAPLTDALVHGQDIRRPLGLAPAFAPERVRRALDFACGVKAFRSRVEGLRFEADDLGWATGEGELVAGHGEAVLLAVAARPVVLPELRGAGVPLLTARLGG